MRQFSKKGQILIHGYTEVCEGEEPFAGSILVYNGKIRQINQTRESRDYEESVNVKWTLVIWC